MLKLYAVLAITAISSSAQTAPMTPELRAFVMRAEEQKAVLGAMEQQWRALVPECATPQLKQMNVGVLEAPVFDEIGNPTRGAWRMVGRMEGCGQSKVLNLRYWFAPEGRLMRSTTLPGTTIAVPLLQKDALFYAQAAMVRLTPKDCKESAVIDTRFLRLGDVSPQARPGMESHVWDEEWQVRACGVVGTVSMHFIPDATGTTISAEMAKAQQ